MFPGTRQQVGHGLNFPSLALYCYASYRDEPMTLQAYFVYSFLTAKSNSWGRCSCQLRSCEVAGGREMCSDELCPEGCGWG
jgi:hypothetical protein